MSRTRILAVPVPERQTSWLFDGNTHLKSAYFIFVKLPDKHFIKRNVDMWKDK